MKLEMMRVFQVVAETGSLAAAANSLGRTPSAISMSLAQFEDRIGGKLFAADRKSELSPFGRLVLEECRRATEAFERSSAAISRHAMSTEGTVRIAAVPSATVSILPGVIARFRQGRPDVRLEISDVDSASVATRVRFGEADIGLVSTAPDGPRDPDVVSEDPLGIAHSQDGPIAKAISRGSAVSWDLLRLEPLVFNPLCNLVDSEVVAELVLGSTMEARNTTALLTLVHYGLGATILPANALSNRPANVAFAMPRDPMASRRLRRISNPKFSLSPVGLAFWKSLSLPD